MLSKSETSGDLLRRLLLCSSDQIGITCLRLTKETLGLRGLLLLIFLDGLLDRLLLFFSLFVDHGAACLSNSATLGTSASHRHGHAHAELANRNCAPQHNDVVLTALDVNEVILVCLTHELQVAWLDLNVLA